MKVKAIVLCGGKGTRLRPLTNEIPKVLIKIRNKPILGFNIHFLKKYGITDIILSVGYLSEKIKEHFGDGSRFGVNITYLTESEPLGTAGPLKLAKDMGLLPKETFVMCNGDELKEINIHEMLRLHENKNASATVALTKVENPSLYGVAKLEDCKILEFVEKPKITESPSNMINAGFYIMEPELVKMIPEGFSMLEKQIFPKIAKKGKLFGFPFDGQWFPTDTIELCKKAGREWKH